VRNPVRNIAHDLNNVFAAILGCADLLAMRVKDNQSALDEATEIQRAAERGARLTRRLFKLRPAARVARQQPAARRRKKKS
jgi:nitrogen-specific signal transduction histidine kinase